MSYKKHGIESCNEEITSKIWSKSGNVFFYIVQEQLYLEEIIVLKIQCHLKVAYCCILSIKILKS